jgi:GT2 family glycosyltransferase
MENKPNSISEVNVAVVIVTFNGQIFIEKCLDSVFASNITVKVLIIDNNSTDETVAIIKAKFPKVDLMVCEENLGFGKANNIGIKQAYLMGAQHVFLLNQDAFIEQDTIEKLVKLQRLNESLVLLSPLQLNGNGNYLDAKFADHLSKSSFIRDVLSDSFLNKSIQELYTIEYANAAAWMMSRNCIELVGLFNPLFEHYGEDFEYLHRINQKGKLIGLVTICKAFHDRDQVVDQNLSGYNKSYKMEKALIRYRLCRKNPSLLNNLLSVLSLAVMSKHSSIIQTLRLKCQLVLFIVINLFNILKKRNEGYAGPFAFFEKTPKFINTNNNY